MPQPRLAPTNDFEPFDQAEIHQGIHQRFEKQAARHGHHVAMKDPQRTVTYRELNHAANQLAYALMPKLQSSRGQVAFFLENDYRAVLAMLGILKSGNAYVPLDPLFPKERLAYMFANSGATTIVSNFRHRDLARGIGGGSTPIVLLEEIDLEKPADDLHLKADPAAMAYILYTSGSTGTPKGIAFGHRNLLHTTMCLINNLHISAEDRMTQLHSASFAASVVDIYCGLLAGASVYPWDVKGQGTAGLAKWLIQENITSIQWIPTPFRQLLETLEEGERFTTPRLVVMASEPLTRREFDLFCKHFPDNCLLVNQMGTSESYNYYLFFASKQTEFEGSVVPAGFPVSPDREVLLLDPAHKEAPPGEIGEISIQSQYMSLGYWGKPDLTADVFLPGPPGTDKKIYLTGDLGRRRAMDGCLLHMGRKDFQVKIRGYRIELPEVELALKKLDGIADVAVMARPDSKGEMKLVAYYLSQGGKDLSVTDLRKRLEDKLPDYMIPNLFIRLEKFPMTPSGKLDKNSLPAPTDSRPVLANQLVAGRTETEQTLTTIWKEVLGHKEIGVMDNYFELGGDSLQAALILHLIHVRCGYDLGYTALVQAPRIADLALLVEQAQMSRSQIGAVGGETQKSKAEGKIRGMFNRLLQVLALYSPGLVTFRPWLHRLRGVRIGKNVAIGTSAIIETARPELIWIGDNVAIGIRNVIIGHFSGSIDRNLKPGEPTVRIGNNVYIGASVTIMPNVTIGDGAVISAGSVVHKSVPPKTMVRGNPAVPVAICEVPLMGEGVTYEEFLRHLKPLGGENQKQ